MPGHGANPIFFNEIYKDWTSSTLANSPTPNVWYDLIFALLSHCPQRFWLIFTCYSRAFIQAGLVMYVFEQRLNFRML